jgi:hypothetical protein
VLIPALLTSVLASVTGALSNVSVGSWRAGYRPGWRWARESQLPLRTAMAGLATWLPVNPSKLIMAVGENQPFARRAFRGSLYIRFNVTVRRATCANSYA